MTISGIAGTTCGSFAIFDPVITARQVPFRPGPVTFYHQK
jgi:hypothetical protein